MPHKNKNGSIEWYRLMLIIIGAMGIILAFVNWYTSGEDIPNGLLTILSLIISAALGPNAVSSIADTVRKNKHPYNEDPPNTHVNSTPPSAQLEDLPTKEEQ